MDSIRTRDEEWRAAHRDDHDYRPSQLPPLTPTYFQVFTDYDARVNAIPDPTSLIIMDEADRLAMNGLEQLRSIRHQWTRHGPDRHAWDRKASLPYPQFFFRIGFFHEFGSLQDGDVEQLCVGTGHLPALTCLRQTPRLRSSQRSSGSLGATSVCSLACCTQMQRVLTINRLDSFSLNVVETARENLVIGQA